MTDMKENSYKILLLFSILMLTFLFPRSVYAKDKIIKDVKPILDLSESTLYTILKRLEDQKMLEVRVVLHEGRVRKYYHITPNGLKRIEDFKNEWKELMDIYSFIVED